MNQLKTMYDSTQLIKLRDSIYLDKPTYTIRLVKWKNKIKDLIIHHLKKTRLNYNFQKISLPLLVV